MPPKKNISLDDFKAMLREELHPSLWRRMLSTLPYFGDFAGIMSTNMDVKREIGRDIGIIDSMTREERSNPKILTKHRRNRIAKGAGVQARRVTLLLRQHQAAAEMLANWQRNQS